MSGRGTAGSWRLRTRQLHLERPRVMGVLNVTPDSFSDGGELRDPSEVVERAGAMVEDGADLLDVGGESTRPGAREVPAEDELERVAPVVEALVSAFPHVPLSIDTRKAAVARRALELGVEVVNDVSGLGHDPFLAPLVAESGAGLVLMHMRGDPGTMERRTSYGDVPAEVAEELAGRLDAADAAGIERDRIVLDPGIGFAKTHRGSFELLADPGPLLALGRPVLVGPSRKRFLGAVVDRGPEERGAATAGACVAAFFSGARIFRVHDVRPVADALAVAAEVAAIARERREGGQGGGG